MTAIYINSIIDLVAAGLFLIALCYLSYVMGFVNGHREEERKILIKKGELQGIVLEIFRAGLEEKERKEELKALEQIQKLLTAGNQGVHEDRVITEALEVCGEAIKKARSEE